RAGGVPPPPAGGGELRGAATAVECRAHRRGAVDRRVVRVQHGERVDSRLHDRSARSDDRSPRLLHRLDRLPLPGTRRGVARGIRAHPAGPHAAVMTACGARLRTRRCAMAPTFTRHELHETTLRITVSIKSV